MTLYAGIQFDQNLLLIQNNKLIWRVNRVLDDYLGRSHVVYNRVILLL